MKKSLFELQKYQCKYGPQLETLLPKSRVSAEELQIRVRSILTSAGKPIRVSEIEKDYKNFFGKTFPANDLNYDTTLDVLENMPEVCEIIGECSNDPLFRVITSEKSVHILDMVRKSVTQPKKKISTSTLKEVFVPFTVQDGMRRILYGKKCIGLDEFYRSLKKEFYLKNMHLDTVDTVLLFQSLPHIAYYDKGLVKSVHPIEESEIKVPYKLQFKDAYMIPSYRLSRIELDIAQKICLLIKEHKILHVMNIRELYVKKFGKELNCNQLGFRDLWRFLSLIPGVFKLTNKAGKQFVMLPECDDGQYGPDLRVLDESKYCGPAVFKTILTKVQLLIAFMTEGLNAQHLLSSYETMYFEKLILRQNLHTFLSELENFNAVRIKRVGENVVLNSCEGDINFDTPVIPRRIMKFQANGYPLDVLQPGESLKSVYFPNVIKPTQQLFCAACVTGIENPNNFYLRLVGLGENHTGEIELKYNKMLVNMEDLYTDSSEELDIPVELLRKGMICAACVSGFWQRAKIVDVFDSFLTVRLLDDGKLANVTPENLKYLKKIFAELPVLNIKASLFNIGPTGFKWSPSAVFEFGSLVTARNIHPIVLSVLIVEKQEDDNYQVVLTDVRKDLELHIGDELVKSGYAVFKCNQKSLQSLFI